MIKRLIWTIWTPMSSVLKKADKLNLSLSLLHLKFFVIVLTCSCPLWSPAHLTHMGLPMDQNTYLSNCWTDYLCPNFCELFRLVVVQHHVIRPFNTKGLAHLTHMGLAYSMWISETVGWILFLSSVELSRLAVVHHLAHLTYMGLPMGQSTYFWNHCADFLG